MVTFKDKQNFNAFYKKLKNNKIPEPVLETIRNIWQSSGSFAEFLHILETMEVTGRFTTGLKIRLRQFILIAQQEIKRENQRERMNGRSSQNKKLLNKSSNSIFNTRVRTRSHRRKGYYKKDGTYVAASSVKSSSRPTKYFFQFGRGVKAIIGFIVKEILKA